MAIIIRSKDFPHKEVNALRLGETLVWFDLSGKKEPPLIFRGQLLNGKVVATAIWASAAIGVLHGGTHGG